MLEFEELVLRNTNENYLLINYGESLYKEQPFEPNLIIDKTSIVMGMSGKANLMLNSEKVIEDGIQVLRRYTGGGTVVVDKSTVFVTLIMNSFDIDCRPYPREIMAWTEGMIYGPTFGNLLMRKPNNQPGSDGAASDEWTFKLRENDYIFRKCESDQNRANDLNNTDEHVIDEFDKKIGGNAQTITKDRWVHHTSFLWDFDPSKMEYLQLPAKRPAYRRDRPHSAFITGLSDKIHSIEAFEREVISQTSRHFDTVKDCGDITGLTSLQRLQEVSNRLRRDNPSFKARSFELSASDKFTLNPKK
jgi:lipoate-protein ligase A